MKQHIREEQWYEEISDKQREIFSKKVPNVNDTLFPSIGQMIEFLGVDIKLIEVRPQLKTNYSIGKNHIFIQNIKYLVDGCWEAIKYKLKQ